MNPRTFLKCIQNADLHDRQPVTETENAILANVLSAFVPIAGFWIYEGINKEASGLLDGIEKKQLNAIVRNVLSRNDVNELLDIKTPQELFDELIIELTPSLQESGLSPSDLNELVAIGTLATSEPNARTVSTPDGLGWVITVNEGMWWFISSFARIIALSFDFSGSNSQTIDVSTREKILADLIKLMATCPRLLREISIVHLKNRGQSAFCERLSMHVKQFIVAHELAHVVLGHLWTQKEQTTQVSIQSGECIPTRWGEEHEADCTGLGLLLRAKDESSSDRDRDLPWAYLGADAFLGILNIVEKAYRITPSSHPSAMERRDKLRLYTRENYPRASAAFFSRAEPLGYLLDSYASKQNNSQ